MGLKSLVSGLRDVLNKPGGSTGSPNQKQSNLNIYEKGRPILEIDCDALLSFPDGEYVFWMTEAKGEPSDSVTDYLLNPHNLKRRNLASAVILDDIKHRKKTEKVSIKWTITFDRDALNVQLHPEYQKNIQRLKEAGWELTERTHTREELKQVVEKIGIFDEG